MLESRVRSSCHDPLVSSILVLKMSDNDSIAALSCVAVVSVEAYALMHK